MLPVKMMIIAMTLGCSALSGASPRDPVKEQYPAPDRDAYNMVIIERSAREVSVKERVPYFMDTSLCDGPSDPRCASYNRRWRPSPQPTSK